MVTVPMRRTDLESIVFFLRRTLPRGEAETDELVRVVGLLEAEIAKRKKASVEKPVG
jgi:hypothetical protein